MKYTEKELIKLEIKRYKTDKLSSNLSLLAVLFNVFYFVCLYKVENIKVYTILLGVSIVYNLLFMLAVFLSSVEIKIYNIKFAIVLLVMGVLQIARIFFLPTKFFLLNTEEDIILTSEVYTKLIIYLVISSALLIASGIVGLINSIRMRNYKKYLQINAQVKGDALCQI
ncbi:MAG: hypothetical protein RRY18_03115 [Clostridia bacterium]